MEKVVFFGLMFIIFAGVLIACIANIKQQFYNKIMVDDSIIVAIITGVFATIGVVVSNLASNKKNAVEQAKRDTKIEDSINELSKRVDSHNGLSDKIIKNTEDICLIQKDIVYIKDEIKELKNIPMCKIK